MNKDFLKTGFFALLVSLVILAAFFELKKFKGEEEVKEEKERLVLLQSQEVKKILYREAQLEREDQKLIWLLTQPINDYLDYELVEEWLSKALSASGSLLSHEGESISWDDFYLDDKKSPKITFQSQKGEQFEFFLSSKKAFDGSSYLRVKSGDKDELFASDANWENVFSRSVESLRSPYLFNWNVAEPSSQAVSITFIEDSKSKLKLEKKEGQWNASSSKFKNWTFDSSLVQSYLDDLKKYRIEGYEENSKVEGEAFKTLLIKTNTGNVYSLKFYKKNLAQSSYRNGVTFKVHKEADEDLFRDALSFRSHQDVLGVDFDPVQISLIRHKKEFAFVKKDQIWEPKNKEDNGAMAFKLIEKLKAINFTRFLDRNKALFETSKKEIVFKNQKGKQESLEVGQKYPCKRGVEKSKNCYLVKSSRLPEHFMVALETDIKEIFSLNFQDSNKNTEGETP